MLFFVIKIIHVLSASILFGLGLTTALYMLWVNKIGTTAQIASATQLVVVADWIFTGLSGIVQPVTGSLLVHIAGYSWGALWVWASQLGYLIAALCWFPVVYFQIKLAKMAKQAAMQQTALPAQYHRYFKYWFWLGWPAFISLVAVFYFMVVRPTTM